MYSGIKSYNNQVLLKLQKQQQMTERRIWKQDEDRILKNIYEDQGVKKWSKISKIMRTVYGIAGRDGKQCRDRYHNHLKCGINKDKWTVEEQNLLIRLHSALGNKWALISRQIKGRTQSFVKNMLYSKLRKSIRELNQFSYMFYRRQLKQIKMPFIYKLVQFTECSLKKAQSQRNDQDIIALDLKQQILTVTYDFAQEMNKQGILRIKSLIQNINTFRKVIMQSRSCNTIPRPKLKATGIKNETAETTSKQIDPEDFVFEQDQEDQEMPVHPQTLDFSTSFDQVPAQDKLVVDKIDNAENQHPLLSQNQELEYPILFQNFNQCWTPHLIPSTLQLEDWCLGPQNWKTRTDYD